MKSKYCPICKKELQGSKMYYGYCSYCGSLLIGEFIPLHENYDDIGATYWNKILYTKVYKQGKCGLIKGYGKEIVPCYYRDAYIDSSNPNMAWVYASSHYGLYNIEKKLAIPCIYVKSDADNPSFSNGISCVFKNVENGNHYIFNDIGNPIREFIVRESEEIFCARYYKEPGLDIFLKIYNDEEYIFYSVLNKEGTEIAKFNCISKSYFPTGWYFYFTGSLYFVFVEDY